MLQFIWVTHNRISLFFVVSIPVRNFDHRKGNLTRFEKMANLISAIQSFKRAARSAHRKLIHKIQSILEEKKLLDYKLMHRTVLMFFFTRIPFSIAEHTHTQSEYTENCESQSRNLNLIPVWTRFVLTRTMVVVRVAVSFVTIK